MSFNRSGYIGRAPGDSAVTIAKQYFQPTSVGKTFTFSSGYDPGLIDVYRNGVKLINVLDYAATDGSTIVLDTPVGVGSTVQVVAYKAFNIATVKATELDTTVTGNTINLTGDITATNATISALTTTQNLNVSGVITATTALHVGSALTANAAGDVETIGIITATKFAGNATGLTGTPNISAGTIGGSTGTFSGAVNIDDTTDSTSTTTGALIVDGGAAIAKNVYIGAGLSVAGTLTYEDVTSVDSVGLITAKSGVNVSGGQVTIGTGITMGIAGVATFSGTSDVHLHDGVKALFGTGSDFEIYHNGSHGFLDSNTGDLRLLGDDLKLMKSDGSSYYVDCNAGTSVDVYYNNSKKFETTNDGVVVTGVCTATSFVGGLPITSGADNRVITASSASAIQGESNFTWDGDDLTLNKTGGDCDLIIQTTTSGDPKLKFNAAGVGGHQLIFDRGENALIFSNGVSERMRISAAGDLELSGTAAGVKSCFWDASATSLIFNDNSKAVFGDGSDLTIYHTGTDSYIKGGSSGELVIRHDAITMQAASSTDTYFDAVYDGEVSLRYNNSKKFETTNDGVKITGIATVTQGLNTDGLLSEKFETVANKLSAAPNIDLEDGMVHYFTTTETTTATPNIRYSSTKTLNNMLSTGDAITVTIITTAAAAGFSASWEIDGTGITEEWVGGSAPTAGGSDGYDIYTANILKTADATFKVFINLVNAT